MKGVALFGVPGAGKGTQSQLLIKKYDYIYIATGDMLRKEIKEQTPLGKVADEVISKGELLGDDIIIKMIAKRLDNHTEGTFLFDGFPRTIAQAHALEQLLIDRGGELMLFIKLELSLEESMTRLLHRAKTSGRSDDNRKIIELRFKEYQHKTAPVSDYFKEKGLYHSVKGLGTVDAVFGELCTIIDNR
ncbi:adenylate kinase [bacterium]|nr:adenylate kinase [bacterium]